MGQRKPPTVVIDNHMLDAIGAHEPMLLSKSTVATKGGASFLGLISPTFLRDGQSAMLPLEQNPTRSVLCHFCLVLLHQASYSGFGLARWERRLQNLAGVTARCIDRRLVSTKTIESQPTRVPHKLHRKQTPFGFNVGLTKRVVSQSPACCTSFFQEPSI